MMDPTHYEVLGVPEGADAATIKGAWRAVALATHPDRNPGDKVSEEKFKAASAAWEVLGNPVKKDEYDTLLMLLRQPRCVLCDEPIAEVGQTLCPFCALQAQFEERARQASRSAAASVPRVPKTPEQELEERYGWSADSRQYASLMDREPGYYDALGSPSQTSDDFLRALMEGAGVRSAQPATRPLGVNVKGGAVEFRLGDDVIVRIDKRTIKKLREVDETFGVTSHLLRHFWSLWTW